MRGYAILQFDKFIDNNAINISAWLQALLGEPIYDKNPGKLTYAKVQAEKNSKFYINSNLTQPMHTDEGHTTQCPRYVALHCVQQSEIGGDSILVPFETLHKALLDQFGDMVKLLYRKDAITVQNVYGEEKKPILLHFEESRSGISYSPVLQKMRSSHDVFELFDYMTKFAHDPNNQIRFKMKPDQILLIENCRVLHGRTAFSHHESRLLYRYWFGNYTL
jgi:hypothetical protein